MDVDVAGLQIVYYPDPVLRTVARQIDTITDTVRAVAARMFELVAEADGAGLAAPQVGLSWRMFVTRSRDDHPDLVYINPTVTRHLGDIVTRSEGCLSLPDLSLDIRRPVAAAVTALDTDGREFTLTDEDMLARVWQHELDHLDGILIIDKMSPMDRIANRRLLKDLEAAART